MSSPLPTPHTRFTLPAFCAQAPSAPRPAFDPPQAPLRLTLTGQGVLRRLAKARVEFPHPETSAEILQARLIAATAVTLQALATREGRPAASSALHVAALCQRIARPVSSVEQDLAWVELRDRPNHLYNPLSPQGPEVLARALADVIGAAPAATEETRRSFLDRLADIATAASRRLTEALADAILASTAAE